MFSENVPISHQPMFRDSISLDLRSFWFEFESFCVGVVSLLLLVELLDDVIDGERVQVLDDQVKHEPVADLFNERQRRRLQDGLDV